MNNKSPEGVESFEYNMWEHVDLSERIDWTEEDCLICGRKEEEGSKR